MSTDHLACFFEISFQDRKALCVPTTLPSAAAEATKQLLERENSLQEGDLREAWLFTTGALDIFYNVSHRCDIFFPINMKHYITPVGYHFVIHCIRLIKVP